MTAPRYDIFLGQNADAIWMEAVDGFGKAYGRMKELAADFPGPYFVFCAQTHSILARIDTSHTTSAENLTRFAT